MLQHVTYIKYAFVVEILEPLKYVSPTAFYEASTYLLKMSMKLFVKNQHETVC